MRIIFLVFVSILMMGNAFAQEPADSLDYLQLDSNQVHRVGFMLGGGVQQLMLNDSEIGNSTGIDNWESQMRGMYRVGVIYNRKLTDRSSLQTGMTICNVTYLVKFTDKGSPRSDTNAYSTMEIPLDYRLTVYKGWQLTGGINYRIDVTKELLRSSRLIELKRNSLSGKVAVGYRFPVGIKYMQVDVFAYYGLTNILKPDNRYSETLKSIMPAQLGLSVLLY